MKTFSRILDAVTGRADQHELVVQIRFLENAVMSVPAYAHHGDAGVDLIAATDTHLPSGKWSLVHTGVAVAIPDGYVGLVHPRSGIAAKFGVTVLNAPGTIDAGYRGEIKVNLVNHSRHTVTVERGERIAQLVFQRVERARFEIVDFLPGSTRGADGHGSTGGMAGAR